MIYGHQYNYEGELDLDGKATGYGIAIGSGDPNSKIEGTFLQDLRHGISRSSFLFLPHPFLIRLFV